ncbi:aminoglycoside phosphotransferase family protein [Bacillus aerolatus]|nr:aminoglycoside phosphotransferase family protein [Bacillus aerolatus]
MKNNFKAGDGFSPRLLFLLSASLQEHIQSILPLKTEKWLITTNKNKWFVKRYASLSQLEKQMKLCAALLESGFTQVIPFHPVSPIKLEKQIFAVMPFVQPAKKSFTFHTTAEREEALCLLASFHHRTELFSTELTTSFPLFDQLSCWQNRLTAFQLDLPELSRYLPSAILRRCAEMGEWCLAQLASRQLNERKPAVIHGDVAAHNFFRAANGKLYLIDFDLAARAPVICDYVQWINRVLPLVGWHLEKLKEHSVISTYTREKDWLLYTLFPADIFRECRRMMHLGSAEKKLFYKHAYELTVSSFAQREYFFRKWKKEWENQKE